MKLYKALKLKKKLVGEISNLQAKIHQKNSFIVGSVDVDKHNVLELYKKLNTTIDELVELKLSINKANLPIQRKIFRLSELKSLITMFGNLSVIEGIHPIGGGFIAGTADREYRAQISETDRDEIVSKLQEELDATQEEMDVYNYTTEI